MAVEVPGCISEIIPVNIAFHLKPYSENGMVFSGSESTEQYLSNCSDRMQSIPDENSTPPHIFIMDFTGIKSLNLKNTRKALSFPLENFRGQRRGNYRRVYSAYVNLSNIYAEHTSPWQDFQNILEGDSRKPVVVARQEGHHDYCLIGNTGKIAEHEKVWRELSGEDSWVNGCEFVDKGFRSKVLYAPQIQLLFRLHMDGLAMRRVYHRKSYFRSIV